MNNKLMATAICLIMAFAMTSAQEKTQINSEDSLSHLYPETENWTFGFTFFTGIDGTYFPNYPQFRSVIPRAQVELSINVSPRHKHLLRLPSPLHSS